MLTTAQTPAQPAGAARQQQHRSKPQQQGGGLEGRIVEHEIAIAGDQILDHFVLAAPGAQLLTHLITQIDRQRRVGFGNRLVLAHQAAQLVRQLHHVGFQLEVAGDRGRQPAFLRQHRPGHHTE